jgi:hypothetical protein
MIPLSELVLNPFYTWWLGLAVGLVVALNVWIWRYAVGYRAGVKYCTEQLEPVRIEVARMAGVGALRHHVSEEMRQAIKAALEAQEGQETRH